MRYATRRRRERYPPAISNRPLPEGEGDGSHPPLPAEKMRPMTTARIVPSAVIMPTVISTLTEGDRLAFHGSRENIGSVSWLARPTGCVPSDNWLGLSTWLGSSTAGGTKMGVVSLRAGASGRGAV